MLFGTPIRFAVECDVDRLPPSNTVVFSRMRLWAGNLPVGDFDETFVLYGVTEWFRRTLIFQGERADQTLSGKPAAEILQTVRHDKFLVAPNGCEAFDGWLAVLMEEAGGERFLWKEENSDVVHETRLDAGEYEAVMREFLNWADPKDAIDEQRVRFFYGKRIVFTGHLTRRSRTDWEKFVRDYDGLIDTRITEATTHLISGTVVKGGEHKIEQARELKIPILSEAEFDAILPKESQLQ